jgi:predicted aldo/keto reductase-like oxidoreductase
MVLGVLPKEKRPSACIGCRSCEEVCPQQIKISEAMADFTQNLEGKRITGSCIHEIRREPELRMLL